MTAILPHVSHVPEYALVLIRSHWPEKGPNEERPWRLGHNDREIGQADQRYVLGQSKPSLRYDRHINQVVEELERTDAAVDDRVAVRTRRPPEPGLEEPEGLPNCPRRRVRHEFVPYGSAAASR